MSERRHDGLFAVDCCRDRRRLVGGVLLCPVCDLGPAAPRWSKAQNVAKDVRRMRTDRK